MLKFAWRLIAQKPPPPRIRPACVSVVVPLYNHERYIADAVRSALGQGPVLREVVVVDDGSTDASVPALQAACGDDPRVVLCSQPNQGAHAAINAGLLRASGDVLCILNSDDVYAPGRLAQLAAALDADPAVHRGSAGDIPAPTLNGDGQA